MTSIMIDDTIKITEAELLELIEGYFDCTLSDEEERFLRCAVARSESSHPAVLKAKAMMGFHTIRRHHPEIQVMTGRGKRSEGIFRMRLHWRRLINIAAILTVIFIGAFYLNTAIGGQSAENRCIAYFNGEKVTDEDQVMEILIDNLSDLDEGAEAAEELMLQDMDEILPLID